jgi:hypothetical protein
MNYWGYAMIHARVVFAATSLVVLLWLSSTPVLAQAEPDTVPLIMLKPQGASFSAQRLRRLYAALKKRSDRATSQMLPLTKTEVWTVPKDQAESMRKTAAHHGVVMSKLSATWNHVFHKAPSNAKISDKQKSILDRARSSLATLSVAMMAAPAPPMVEYALTKDPNVRSSSQDAPTIAVTLSDNSVLTIRRTSIDVKTDFCIWRGIVETTGAPATIIWWPDGKMTGTIQHQGRIYSIRHLGAQLQAVVELGEERMPPEHAPMTQGQRTNDPNLQDDPLVRQGDASKLKRSTGAANPRDPKAPPTVKTAPSSSDEIIIDVIIAYTKKAAANYNDVKRELIDLSIEEANDSFRKSGIAKVKLRLAHAYQTDYVEEGEHFLHVWRFADKGDGYMDEIHGLRDKFRADVAVLIVDDSQGCGLATRVYADENEAFAVVHHECAATTYSVAHEIGHIIGARHDLSLDTSTTPFSYGHGFVNGTKWRDIMSYKKSCGGCPRLPIWSSPKVTINGDAAGTAETDNARVIVEQAARVAAFR